MLGRAGLYPPKKTPHYKAMVADYQKASGNTIDYSIIPFAPMREKDGLGGTPLCVVPDMMETADFNFSLYLNAW